MNKTEEKWTKIAAKKLIGKRIVAVEYMTDEEIEKAGWSKRPLCIRLDNHAWIYPQMDDEGNDGGALYYTGNGPEDAETLPVI
jgi:hypothetical protein